MNMGLRVQMLALCPELPPRLHPRGPQAQIGTDAVAQLLFGGRSTVLGYSGSRVGAATQTMLSALAASAAVLSGDPVAAAVASAVALAVS